MDDFNFNRLLQSVDEAKKIMQGKKEPIRRFVFKEPNQKDIRAKFKNLSKNKDF